MTSAEAQIIVEPEESMFDSDLHTFVVKGLRPKKRYHVSLFLKHKSTFHSTAMFTSDDNGEIDLATSTAAHGHYYGKDIMGLFTSMYHEHDARMGTNLSLMPMPDCLEYVIQVRDRDRFAAGKIILEKKIKRLLRDPSLERIEVVHPILEGVIYKPQGVGPFQCLIDMYGFLGMQEHRAALLSNKGFAVFSLRLIGGKKTPPAFIMMDSTYLMTALDWYSSQPYCNGPIGVIGISAGASAALYMASKSPKICATVAINGSSVFSIHTVFKENGKLMPFYDTPPDEFKNIDFRAGAMNYHNIDRNALYSETVQHKLERSRGKYLLIAGEEDGTADSVGHAYRLMNRLIRHGMAQNGTVFVAPKTGHIIDPPFVPVIDLVYARNINVMLDFGGHPYHHGVQQRELWPKIINFFKENIPMQEKHGSKL